MIAENNELNEFFNKNLFGFLKSFFYIIPFWAGPVIAECKVFYKLM